MFHDINDLFILFYPKINSETKNKTKRFKDVNTNKKTKRKQLKETIT
jgi:hypothetical protein